MPQSRLVLPGAQRRVGRGWQIARALYRNGLTAWNEFRQPIVILLVALFGGGWLYGELLVRAGYDRIPYVDLPYSMLSLMLFNPAGDLPREPELIAFWYAMPVIAAYVAGRGVFDFIQLFFNPNEHHTSWEEAVASTYRNHVIVLGVGHLGLRVIRSLVEMGFEVVAIDIKSQPDKTEQLRELSVPLVLGDGRMPATMETAGLRHAQAFIVCTSNDYLNLEVTMRARDLNPDIRIVVRMWEEQFAAQIRRFMNVEAVLSATTLAAPSFAGAALGIDITQTLTISGEDYSMIRLIVEEGSFLDGASIETLQNEHRMDIVLHEQDGHVEVHPPVEDIVCSGDTLVIFAQHSKIIDVVGRNRKAAISS
jgi:Trk K+ transport system NAD-binding subunit